MVRKASGIIAAGTILLSFVCIRSVQSAGDDGHWPQWRGPSATGMARTGAPLHWSDTENVRWQVEVPGKGHSTPVIWGDRLFITAAIATGKPAAPAAESTDEGSGRRGRGRGSFHGGGGPLVEHSFELLSFDRNTGKLLWQRAASVTTPHEGVHGTYGSFASNSAITDGEHVYAFFGSRGLFAYDMDGNPVWEKDLGSMRIRVGFGEGASPALHGDSVIVNFDHEGDSFIAAYDKRTGEERWKTPRNEFTSWTTPLVLEHEGRAEIVVAATGKVRSYDFRTGGLIWECAGLGLNSIPTPVTSGDAVYVMTGFRPPRVLLAIQLGREGDLTGSEAIAWTIDRGTSYTPSPVIHDGKLYFLMDSGMISCVDVKTGKPYYQQQRLPGRHSFKASPVGAGDKLYLASEQGKVLVLKMGEEFDVLATNTHPDQVFLASPAVAEGNLYLRSQNRLYCIGEAGAAAGGD